MPVNGNCCGGALNRARGYTIMFSGILVCCFNARTDGNSSLHAQATVDEFMDLVFYVPAESNSWNTNMFAFQSVGFGTVRSYDIFSGSGCGGSPIASPSGQAKMAIAVNQGGMGYGGGSTSGSSGGDPTCVVSARIQSPEDQLYTFVATASSLSTISQILNNQSVCGSTGYNLGTVSIRSHAGIPTFSPTSASYSNAAFTGSITVTIAAGLNGDTSWVTAVSGSAFGDTILGGGLGTAPFVTITSVHTGSGSFTLTYSGTANTSGSSRVNYINVNAVLYQVDQAA
jgi:hypothetical protein